VTVIVEQQRQRVEFQVPRSASASWLLRCTSTIRSCSIRSAKFASGEGEHWFATGLEDGSVHVYSYSTPDAASAAFPAHPHKPVTSLAVHPTEPSLLTAADGDPWIKLWRRRSNDDGSTSWMCAQQFNNQSGGSVQRLTFDVSACASLSDQGVKVC
jgi:WD40 repeat protein